MKNICFVNGSLRGSKSASLTFLNHIDSMLKDSDYIKETITAQAKVTDSFVAESLSKMKRADVIILMFPLYVYGLPSILMRLLEEYTRVRRDEAGKRQELYAVVNSGFLHPEIMGECVRTMKNFCARASINRRFSVCIGGGAVAAPLLKVPLLNGKYRKAFRDLSTDIKRDAAEPKKDYYIKPPIPEGILLWFKARYEKKMQAMTHGTDAR